MAARAKKGSVSTEFRMVHFGTERVAEHKFCNNKIRTALYVRGTLTPFIFVVKGICIEEFSKLANFYFLIVVGLQMWNETTNTGGLPTTLPALSMVVAFASILKFVQDIERARADHTLNTAKCERLIGGKFVVGAWTDVQVGDFVKVHNREMLPADIVLFAAHEPNPEQSIGVCHVETKSLDGETNLKGRSVPKLMLNLAGPRPEQQVRELSKLRGYVECEQPNAATTKFTGKVRLEDGTETALSINNVLLRSSSVRNTDYVIGLVINTGADSKVMQGQQPPKLKRSTLDRGINLLMVGVICLQLVLCLVCTLMQAAYDDEQKPGGDQPAWYLHTGEDATHSAVVGILRFFVLLAAFVSVSLYVSVDSNKFIMKTIMEKQPAMQHAESQTRLKVRTMTLIDELGCISHVFSDKTGTLTQNMMQFRKCSVYGVSYGKGNTEIGLARLARLGQLPAGAENSSSAAGAKKGKSGAVSPVESATAQANSSSVNFDGPELFAALRGEMGEEQRDRCRDFVLLLALCHTVVVEQVGSEKKLSASSPDEAALVDAAAYLGIEFVNKQHQTVTLRDSFESSQPKYEVLEVLEFSSARKRMSVVVQDVKTGRIRLLSKGADSVMLPLITQGEQDLKRKTERHLEDHANDGLRTLILTHRDVERDEFAAWSARFRAALVDLTEIEKKEKELPNEIERLMGEIETNLHMVGSTAIEDKLQVGVPKAIADMGRAGIAVWVLTGDKEETAINIAFACELFDARTKVLVLNLKSHPTAKEVGNELVKHGHTAAKSTSTGEKHALVVDGDVISLVMADPKLQLELLQLTMHCQSVIACRCAPSQKAQLVTLVKRNVQGAVTLAIGDGANDVAMIQAAHVGVGISGQEGMQAANSADFSVGQFRFLTELLFVWGRNAYRRMSTMIFYLLYKNILLVLITYWFLFDSAAAGTRIYLEAVLQFFNLIWTFLPIIICTIYDRDVSDDMARKLPQLYHLGVRKVYFNSSKVLQWVVLVLLESLAIYYAITLATPKMVTSQGRDPGVTYIGDFAFALVLVVVTLKLALEQYQITWAQHGIMAFCVVIWWPLAYIMNWGQWMGGSFTGPYVKNYAGLFKMVQEEPVYWLLLLLVPATTQLLQLYLVVYQRAFYPEFRDLAMETEFWGLDTHHLEQWQIPLAQRRFSLFKDAPRVLTETTLQRWYRKLIDTGGKGN